MMHRFASVYSHTNDWTRVRDEKISRFDECPRSLSPLTFLPIVVLGKGHLIVLHYADPFSYSKVFLSHTRSCFHLSSFSDKQNTNTLPNSLLKSRMEWSFVSFCLGSTKGRPVGRLPILNIYSAVTSSLPSGCFTIHFLPTILWFFILL